MRKVRGYSRLPNERKMAWSYSPKSVLEWCFMMMKETPCLFLQLRLSSHTSFQYLILGTKTEFQLKPISFQYELLECIPYMAKLMALTYYSLTLDTAQSLREKQLSEELN